jgi:Rne/Rng family ribonuclease
MSKEMVISATPHETRVAIMEEGQLCEIYVEREKEFALVGSIYKGKVTRVLPGMQSSFVEIGLDSDAFLYVTDFLEEIEEFDHVVTEDKSAHAAESPAGPASVPEPHAAPASPVASTEAPVSESDMSDDALHAAITGDEAPRSAQPEQTVRPPAPRHSPPSQPYQQRSSAPPSGGQSRPPGRGFEGRDRGQGRSGGGGFSRDRGRRGRPGGRRSGPGGGGGGGGRGGDPRFGRDLPASKYASHRPYEPPTEEAGSAEESNLPPILLPGESLAKYRARPAESLSAPAPSAASESAAPVAEHGYQTHSPEPEAQPESRPEANLHAAAEPHLAAAEPQQRPAWMAPARGEYQGIDILPGESLAKTRRSAPVVPPVESEPAHAAHQTHSQASRAEESHVEESHAQESHGGPADSHEPDNSVPEHLTAENGRLADLSEEEARALAEHVAEVQLEESHLETAVRGESDEEEENDDSLSLDSGPVSEADGMESAEEVEAAEAESSERHSAESAADDAETEASGEDYEAPVLDAAGNPIDIEKIQEEAQAAVEGTSVAPTEDSEGAIHAAGAEAGSSDVVDSGDPSVSPAVTQPQRARVSGDYRARMQQPARRGGGGRDRGRRDDRGRRPQHGHSGGGSRPQQSRRTPLISDLLKQGQEIIVQIAKEPLGKKGARITSHIALPGRFLVYMPTLSHTGVSRKIGSAEDRSRLRHLVTEAKGSFGGGFIVRTAAEKATPDEIRTDVEFLTQTWSKIKGKADTAKAPSLLHRDLNLVERILRDFLSPDFGAIWVDNEEAFTKVVDFVSRFQPALVNRVKLYSKATPVFEEFGIQQEIDKGLRPKVWLKSGGYIVINHTEALVAIDVNTGKFVGRGSTRLEDTIVRTNVEAVKEIVRQMRLRDLGGIIVIDFIDMEERRNREKVMAALEDALRADRAPSKVLRFNEFGLVAITRKRTKQALERTLCQPCPYCTGSGMVKSIPTLCYEIQTEARKMAPEVEAGSLTLRVHPEISKALKTRESSLMEELETWTKKSIIIQADPTLHWEQYDIY